MQDIKSFVDTAPSFMEQKKDFDVTLKKVEKISGSLLERIIKLAVKGLSRMDKLSDVCKFISTTLNSRYGEEQSWICMASTDSNMCGYVPRCKGYIQFTVDEYYFLVVSTFI